MTRIALLLILCLGLPAATYAQRPAGQVIRVLLIPLDDRPNSTMLPQHLGLIDDAEVVLPPRDLLGKFTTAGQSDKIIDWLKSQQKGTFDFVIASLDMLAYGGLVGSRMHRVESADALRRVEFLRTLARQMPQAKIYAHNVVMRLAPTPGDSSEVYRARLARWAEISAGTDAEDQKATAALEREIPATVLADYKATRRRNLLTNFKAIELVKEGVIGYLLLSQDDARPQGIHVAEREKLLSEIQNQGLGTKIAVQPGADEASMILLSRALSGMHEHRPRVMAVYSSVSTQNATMPFEDQPLHRTVSQHIRATGAEEVTDEPQADLFFYVYASRQEADRAETFAAEIGAGIKAGKRIVVADIDPVGDVQGSDPNFAEVLNRRNLFPALSGYAAWNTAANTIGTALSQGVIFTLAEADLDKNKKLSSRLVAAQHWFTLHRVMDDYYFHTLVRDQTNAYLHQQKRSSLIMSDEDTKRAESFSRKPLQSYFDTFTRNYFQRLPGSYTCQGADFQFSLPWNRMFEAKFDFKVSCSSNNR